MSHGRLGFDSLFRIPSKTFGDEVDKLLIVTPKDLSKGFSTRSPSSTLRVDDWAGSAMVIEKNPLARTLVNEILVWKSKNLHNTSKLFLFVFTREDRKSSVELG
jgi:hypothetical protein